MSITFCDGFLVMTVVEWLKQNSPSVGLLDYWLVLCFNFFHFNQYQPHLMIESYHIEVEFAKCWTALSLFVLQHLPFQAMTAAFCDGVQWKIVVEWLIGFILKQNSPSVALLDYWSVSCFNPFLFKQCLPHFVMAFRECWRSKWLISITMKQNSPVLD